MDNAVKLYDLIVYVNDELLNELERNIFKMLLYDGANTTMVIRSIMEFVTYFETIPTYLNSPDPKDNFLFDLALQTKSEVIVTKEKVLLNFTESPVPIHDIKWFKEKYPVEL